MRLIIQVKKKKKKKKENATSKFDFSLIVIVAQSQDTQIFNTRYPLTCKVYVGLHDTSSILHGSPVCMVDSPLAKARGLSLHTGQTVLYLPLISYCMRKKHA